MTTDGDDDHSDLRQQAERRLLDRRNRASPANAEEADRLKLLHELQVHHIELEMQNEELQQIWLDLDSALERYVDLYYLAPVAYFTLASDGGIREVNLAGAVFLGVDRAKLIGRPLAIFIAPESLPEFNACLLKASAAHVKASCEAKMPSADGPVRHVHFDAIAIESGQACRVVAMDITDNIRAKEVLLDADRQKDEFLAMLAHELRNPLVPIRNAAYVIGRLDQAEPQLKWAQSIIDRQVRYMSRLVDDLLDISRIVKGKIELKRERIEFADVVERAMETAQLLVDAKGHRLDIALPGEPVWLDGDAVRLIQVVVNLLGNAAKYTDPGGHIELTAEVVGRELALRVRDNGIGIPASLMPHIFDLFSQGECSLDRAQGGLGIGLTLVRRLVELHGGRVQAVSAGPDKGAEFTVWLPILANPVGLVGTPHDLLRQAAG